MNIQEAFPFISKADWLAQVAKDLKGADLSTLNWAVSERISANPLVAAADFPVPPAPIDYAPNDWRIVELVKVADAVAANEQAMEALRLGAQGIRFYLETAPDRPFLAALLQDIYLDFIDLHFEGPGASSNPGAILALLAQIAAEKGLSTQQLNGSIDYAPDAQATITDWRYLGELIDFAAASFPGFRLIHLHEQANSPVEKGLAQLLQRSHHYLQNLESRGFSPAKAAGAMQFTLLTGKHYFVEIARIRAFKQLWINFLNGWELSKSWPVVHVEFAPEVYKDDVYTNMVKSTTMAMSAALGGANSITVRPYDDGRTHLSDHSEAFAKRIARNVQHLLKMESGFDQLADPAAGSYYIESLTRQIGEAAWEAFSQ